MGRHNHPMLLRPLCAILVALPWLWPFTAGPTATLVPYLVSAIVGALLMVMWPARDQEGLAFESGASIAASGWLAAALISGVIALLQYFDLETPFYPWSTSPNPARLSATCANPINWLRCW